MNKSTIFARTGTASQAAASDPRTLAGDLRRILEAIDGTSSVSDLRKRFGDLSAAAVDDALAALVAADLIGEVAQMPTSASRPADGGPDQDDPAALGGDESARKAQELRAKIRARREGAERPAADAEGQAHPVDDVQARREAEEQAQREEMERGRRQAEEQLRQEAAAKARREVEELARQEAAERARQAAEEQRQQEAEARARREEEAAAREAAELARQEAEVAARRAEEQAWRDAEEKARRKQEATARKRAKDRAAAPGVGEWLRKWGKALVFGVGALLLLGLAAIHLVSFDSRIPQFETALARHFQQPVKITALHLSLVPQTHLKLEGVVIGNEGQVRIPLIKAVGPLGNLFGQKKAFTSIELDSPLIGEEGLGWVLFGKPAPSELGFGELKVRNATLDSKNLRLVPFDAKLQTDGAGAWKSIVVEAQDKSFGLQLSPKNDAVLVEFTARSFKLPFGSALAFDDLTAQGEVNRAGLAVSEFKGFAYGGTLSGNARLTWGANWRLAGQVNAKQIDTARMLPQLLDGARLEGTAAYAMQAPQAATLFAAPHLEGTFAIQRGTLLGVDLGRVLQGGGVRGDTAFTELGGSFVHDHGATQLQQLSLRQGGLAASGTAEVDAERKLRGRITVGLKLSTEQLSARLALSGNLANIEWRRQ